jgi:2-amino-4-hydroxy-6-hydroxymethyldihydropteridine diphosphokinase
VNSAFIALGGNLGDVKQTFQTAYDALKMTCNIIAVSKLYQTPALTMPDSPPQPDYWNAAIHVQTQLPADTLLAELHRVEALHHRKRIEHWGSRTLDLDLIAYEQLISTQANLKLPHPETQSRLFVLQPLIDIAPFWVHPVTGESLSTMITNLTDAGEKLHKGEAWQLQH